MCYVKFVFRKVQTPEMVNVCSQKIERNHSSPNSEFSVSVASSSTSK